MKQTIVLSIDISHRVYPIMRNYSKHCLVKKTYIHYRSYRGTFEILKQGGKCMYKSAETNCVNFKFSGNLLVKAYNYICTSTIFGSNVYMYNIVMTNILDILRLINTHLEVNLVFIDYA